MAPTEEEWAAMASKYGYGINADEATKDELIEFVQTAIYLHETQDITDNDLWAVFREQFEGFTVESFKKIRTDFRSKLRRHLLKRGVYVGNHSNRVTISELLFEVIQQEERHQWTDEDIETTLKELAEPLTTRALRHRLNHTLDGLAIGPKSFQPTATATIPPGTQTPTPMTPQTPVVFTPQQAAPTATQQQYYPQTPVVSVPQQPAQQQHNFQQPAQQQHNFQQPAQQQCSPQRPGQQQNTLLQPTQQHNFQQPAQQPD